LVRCAARVGEMRSKGYMSLVEKLEGELRYERPKRRWKDNIKIDLTKWFVECIYVPQGGVPSLR
jgi:hypothetical protein